MGHPEITVTVPVGPGFLLFPDTLTFFFLEDLSQTLCTRGLKLESEERATFTQSTVLLLT